MMYGHEKSDSAIVAVKPTNKAGQRDQDVGGDLRQQCVGADQIVNLSWGQQKAQWVAERVDQGVDLGAQRQGLL
jgi:hypothetical protein